MKVRIIGTLIVGLFWVFTASGLWLVTFRVGTAYLWGMSLDRGDLLVLALTFTLVGFAMTFWSYRPRRTAR